MKIIGHTITGCDGIKKPVEHHIPSKTQRNAEFEKCFIRNHELYGNKYRVNSKRDGYWVCSKLYPDIESAIMRGNQFADQGENAQIVDLKTGSVIWEVNL